MALHRHDFSGMLENRDLTGMSDEEIAKLLREIEQQELTGQSNTKALGEMRWPPPKPPFLAEFAANTPGGLARATVDAVESLGEMIPHLPASLEQRTLNIDRHPFQSTVGNLGKAASEGFAQAKAAFPAMIEDLRANPNLGERIGSALEPSLRSEGAGAFMDATDAIPGVAFGKVGKVLASLGSALGTAAMLPGKIKKLRIKAVAMKLPDQTIVAGMPGELHGDIANRVPSAGKSGVESGFLDSDGNFLTRDEAAVLTKSTDEMGSDAAVMGARGQVESLKDSQNDLRSFVTDNDLADVEKVARGAPALAAGGVPNMQPGTRISTRLPTAKAPGLEDGINDNSLRVDMETFNRQPRLVETFAEYRKGHPDYLPGADPSAAGVLEDLKKMVVDNLLWLHDQIPGQVRNRSKKWYDGANRIAGEFGQEFGVTLDAAAGVLATQSPQRDWFQNITLAERILDVHQNRGQHVWDDAMTATAARIYSKPKFKEQLAFVAGKKYDDLAEPMDKAMWLRAFSEANHKNEFHIYSPEGERMGLQTTGKGATHAVGWGSLSEVAKAVRVLEAPVDQQAAAIAFEMGDAHKVRNFYNNIIDPNSNAGDVTMDTHAIAAAHLRPLAGSDLEVEHNLGTGGSDSKLGLRGNYAVYADAYREAAAARNILPREMQSITWEAIRSLYSAEFKRTPQASHMASLQRKVADGLAGKRAAVKKDGSPKMTAEMAAKLWEGSLEQVWREQYQTGRVTIDQMREEIVRRAGGFDRPDWIQ